MLRLLPFRLSLLIAISLAGTAAIAFAQSAASPPPPGSSAAPSYAPRSGDPWVDRHLADINLYAARYPRSFADEVSRYYDVPRAYVEAMQRQSSWQAGDIFMACALARSVAQPCRAVVREWSRDPAGGWAEVAERMQPQPARARHRELRRNITDSYRRWARPLLE